MVNRRITADGRIVLRACYSAYVVFAVIFGFISLLSGLAAADQQSMRPIFLVCVAGLAFSMAWLRSFRLEISEDTLTYRRLWGGTSTFRLTEIESIRHESGIDEYSDRFKPFVRLVVKTNTPKNHQTICINLKVFSAAEIRDLTELLRAKCVAIDAGCVLKNL